MKVFISFFIFSVLVFAHQLISPIPLSSNYHEVKANLGKKLFHDTILSQDNTVSCASCHLLEDGGDDNSVFSKGVNGKQTSYNTPTVFNVIYNFKHTWMGSEANLETRILSVIENKNEMGYSIKEIVAKLEQHPVYVIEFNKLFSDSVTADNLIAVLSEFMSALSTPNARFDRYLRGDNNAISKDAKIGYELFHSKGCISCHNGVNVGGNMYNKFGIFKANLNTSLGRYLITGREEDKYVYRVPSLRNVELTAPYMHDGSIGTLNEAVELMSHYQLGRHMKEGDIEKIVAFLQSLTGEMPVILTKGN